MAPQIIEMLLKIFELCVIPLIGVLTTYLVKFIQAKSDELVEKSEDAMVDKYIVLTSNVITACVMATSQTYVDSLKAQGKFDAEAQKEAFERTKSAVEAILTEEAKEVLAEVFGDVNAYITAKIESAVNIYK